MALAAVAASLLGPTAVAHAAGTIPQVGFNDIRVDGILVADHADWNAKRDLDLAANAGAQLYRARIRMDCVDPGRTGSYDFTTPSSYCWGISYDRLVKELAMRDQTLLPVLMTFKGPLNGSERPQPPTADGADGSVTIDAWRAFAAAAARRYGTNGTFWDTCGCPRHPVSGWEVWNEENVNDYWGGRASASEYAELFRATRAGLRDGDAQARAVVGGLVLDPGAPGYVSPRAIVGELAKNNANAFDAVAAHPYTDPRGRTGAQLAADALAKVESVSDAVLDATGERRPIWVTEMGWPDSQVAPQTVAEGFAAFLGLLDAGARARLNVGPVVWFMLRDNDRFGGNDDALGMRKTTARGGDAGAKPVWAVFASATRSAPVTLPAVLQDGPARPVSARQDLNARPSTADQVTTPAAAAAAAPAQAAVAAAPTVQPTTVATTTVAKKAVAKKKVAKKKAKKVSAKARAKAARAKKAKARAAALVRS